MTNLVPLTIELEETLHRAILLRATKLGVLPAEVVQGLLRKDLAAEIGEASGLPPLAAMIQNHHDREQGALRSQNKNPRKE